MTQEHSADLSLEPQQTSAQAAERQQRRKNRRACSKLEKTPPPMQDSNALQLDGTPTSREKQSRDQQFVRNKRGKGSLPGSKPTGGPGKPPLVS